MNYSVVTTPDADEALADAWMLASDKTAVTSAQFHIEHLLASDPQRHGEYVSEGLWRIEVVPVCAAFEIDTTRHEVTITGFSLLN